MGRDESLVESLGFILSAISLTPSGYCEEHRWRRWEWVEDGRCGREPVLEWGEAHGPDLCGGMGARKKCVADSLPGEWSEWVVSGVKDFPGVSGFGLQVWVQ